MFVQVDFDEICGGVYEWRKIKDIIVRECGWVAPDESDKELHISCKIEKCKEPSYTQLPEVYKNPLADILPKQRSRIGLKILKNEDCNGCNICAQRCSFGAIKSGITNRKCIRCLKCVEACPNQAIKLCWACR